MTKNIDYTVMKDVKETIEDLILDIKKIRGVPQFLYAGPIGPHGVIMVRSKIISFKMKFPECKEIDFIINSPGGSPDDAYRIIRTLRLNFETVNVIVPFWAKSAATLLSLGASTIVMDEFGEFGPLDMQIGKERDDSPEYERESVLNDEHSVLRIETRFKEMFEAMYIRIYEHSKINISKHEVSKQLLENLAKFYEPLLKQINPYKLGEKRRILDIGTQYAKRILLQFAGVKIEDSRRFVDFLINECPDHGYVIDYTIVKQFLKFVKTPIEFSTEEYANSLRRLSLCILVNEVQEESLKYIDFINEKENDKISNKSDNIANERQKNTTPKKSQKPTTKKRTKITIDQSLKNNAKQKDNIPVSNGQAK